MRKERECVCECIQSQYKRKGGWREEERQETTNKKRTPLPSLHVICQTSSTLPSPLHIQSLLLCISLSLCVSLQDIYRRSCPFYTKSCASILPDVPGPPTPPPPTIALYIMAQYFFDLLYNFTDCMCCFPSSPQLKINNRSFKLLRLLGEVWIPDNDSCKLV